MREVDRLFLKTVCLDPRSRPGTSNCSRGGTRHTRTNGAGHSTGRGHHLEINIDKLFICKNIPNTIISLDNNYVAKSTSSKIKNHRKFI